MLLPTFCTPRSKISGNKMEGSHINPMTGAAEYLPSWLAASPAVNFTTL
jgi:hypothetical protein